MNDDTLCIGCHERPAEVSFAAGGVCVPCARESLYKNACRMNSDIHEHLPLLRTLASRCEHVTEFGTRWGNGSTIAFLAAQPKTFVAWDLSPALVVSKQIESLVRVAGSTRFQPRTGNTLEFVTEPTDLLFIDTLHTGKQLLSELERHCNPQDPRGSPVRKYIVLHDTSTFGVTGEDGGVGLRTAINQFQRLFAFPLWKLMDDSVALGQHDPNRVHTTPQKLDLGNCSGLVVLEHVCADGHSPDKLRGHCHWCGRHVA